MGEMRRRGFFRRAAPTSSSSSSRLTVIAASSRQHNTTVLLLLPSSASSSLPSLCFLLRTARGARLLCAANIVLEETFERIYVGDKFGDIPLGVYLIRGENVALMGQVVRVWKGRGRFGDIDI